MDIRADLTIRAEPSAVWDVIGGQFGRIADWASPIIASTVDGPVAVGATRSCQIAGFGPVAPGVIREQLTTFDPGQMAFAYEAIDGMPDFVTSAVNRWRVSTHPSGGSIVHVHATMVLALPIRLVSPLFAWRMRRESAILLGELRHRVETGQPHGRKVAALTAAGPEVAM